MKSITVGNTIRAVGYTNDAAPFVLSGGLITEDLLPPFTTGTTGPRGSIHASRTGVANLYDAEQIGDVPLFVHSDTDIAKTALAQFCATGATNTDACLNVGTNATEVALQGFRYNGAGKRKIHLNPGGGMISIGDTLFASLGTPANGTFTYCSNCTKATPCAGGGNGALAKRLNGAWDCD